MNVLCIPLLLIFYISHIVSNSQFSSESPIIEKWQSFYAKLLCVFFVKTKKILRARWRKTYNQF